MFKEIVNRKKNGYSLTMKGTKSNEIYKLPVIIAEVSDSGSCKYLGRMSTKLKLEENTQEPILFAICPG